MIIHVHVKPNCKADSIRLHANNELHVRISARPINGKANKYLIDYLSKIFRISKSSLQILKGLYTSHKTIEITAEDYHIKNILSALEQD